MLLQDLPPEAQAQVRLAQEMAAKLMAQAAAQPQQQQQPLQAAPAPAEVNPMLQAAQKIARQLAEKVRFVHLHTGSVNQILLFC